jgi:hypothetical protein
MSIQQNFRFAHTLLLLTSLVGWSGCDAVEGEPSEADALSADLELTDEQALAADLSLAEPDELTQELDFTAPSAASGGCEPGPFVCVSGPNPNFLLACQRIWKGYTSGIVVGEPCGLLWCCY